jgi:hypothetical protein
MSSEQPEHFTVDRLPRVTSAIRKFASKAKELGQAKEILDVFKQIVSKLESQPLEWGDPLFATKQQNGVVFHGLHSPFIVRYVVFESKRFVCILDIKAFPRHPLAES